MQFHNKMDQEIVSVINRVLFQPQALAYIKIMNAMRNVEGVIMAITHQFVGVEHALRYCRITITAARTVDN